MKNNQPPPLGWPDTPLVTRQQVIDGGIVATMLGVLAYAAAITARAARRRLW